MPDPEFPGEDEHLFFVLVEFNVEDVRELKRITELELQGSLDADGLKAFVEVSKSQIVGVSLGRWWVFFPSDKVQLYIVFCIYNLNLAIHHMYMIYLEV